MDKTIKINLGGTLFQINEESYRMLRDYLQEIDSRFRNIQGGYETIEDLELRIAEIFQSQKGLADVITKENVEAMISIIGKPEDFGQFENENLPPYYSSKRKKMYRNPDDSIIGGVCGGIGAYLDTDPVWIRILFILFAVFFGIGILIYLALWIALPSAKTDLQKKEMLGSAYYSSIRQTRKEGDYQVISRAGSAFNEVFRALGKVFFIFFKVILIIAGTILVLTGFLTLLSFVIVFLFRYPSSFSTNIDGANLSYIPDFLNFIVTPAVAPWITILLSVIVILPLLALIYWGVKMIFWFKGKDGIFALTALVIWVMSIAALSIILFNEGVGYAEKGKTISRDTLNRSPDTIYIKPDNRLANLKYDNEISIPHQNYYLYIAEDTKEVFVRTNLTFETSENKSTEVEVRKSSAGRNRSDAIQKAKALGYNFRHLGDTLFFDEYLTYPSGNKWAFDRVGVTLRIPEGTVVQMGTSTENIVHPNLSNYYDPDIDNSDHEKKFWKLTKEGLVPAEPKHK